MTSTSAPSRGMTYARARLFLGASAVGTVSVVATLSLLLDLPALLPTEPGVLAFDVAWVGLVVAIAAAIMAPFDLFGGWLLPREYGRSQERLAPFVARYVHGVIVHGAVVVGAASLLMATARVAGSTATLAAFLLVSAFLLVAQPWLAAVIGRHRVRPARGAEAAADKGARTLVLEGAPRHVTGGAYGLPGRGAWVVPDHWLERADAVAIGIQLRRRAWLTTSGSRDRGVVLALAWNVVPVLAFVASSGPPDSVAAVTRLALVSTLWSFAGLFVLPAPSRRAVYQADRAAVCAGADRIALEHAIGNLERDQDDEHVRTVSVESVFHPIPAAQHRVRALRAPTTPAVAGGSAWHAARTGLYLSWAGVGLLGRAVHCTLGRPECWVFLPSD